MKEGEMAGLLRNGIRKLRPYTPGRSAESVREEYGLDRVYKMASNENPWGPSKRALEKMRESLSMAHIYPDGSSSELTAALAERTGLGEEYITLGNGTDNVIASTVTAFVSPGEEALIPRPTFPIYESEVLKACGRPVHVGLKEHRPHLEKMLKLITPDTRLVFICSPNNPTGRIVPRDELEAFLGRLPGRVITVLDEAYAEYVESRDYPDSTEYIREGHRIVVLRTFSKAYGLAGLRVGYGLAPPEIIDCIERVREPFAVNRVAQAGAAAALRDRRYLRRVVEANRRGREFLCESLAERDLEFIPSEANFMLVNPGLPIGDVCEGLLRRGIIVRSGETWGLRDYIRVSIGSMEANRAFIAALDEIGV